MRGKRTAILVILTVLSGSLAGYSTLRFLQSRPATLIAAEPEAPSRPVVVAARDLELGSIVREEDLQLVQWPGDAVPAGYATAIAEVIGRGVVRDISMNEPLLASKLADMAAGGGLPIVIPEGMRAVSVKVDEVIGVAGFVLPGTRVDVLVTMRTSSGAEPRTRVILQNVRAVAAGQQIEHDEEGRPVSVTVITVLVTPEDAERLVLAASEGRIQMALRNTLDIQDVETNGSRVGSLLAGSSAPRSSARSTSAPRQPQNTGIVEMYRAGVRTLVQHKKGN